MTGRESIIARFSGDGGGRSPWLPDLRLWHKWHRSRGSLPSEWRDLPLEGVCRSLGVPVWTTVRPWRVEHVGVEIRSSESESERVMTWATVAGDLTARWILGPDGDWWQTDYPIKTEADVPAARAVAEARRYVADAALWQSRAVEIGEAGVVAIELPRRPFSEVLNTMLGWSDGMMLLHGDGADAIIEIVAILEEKVQSCVDAVSAMPGQVVYSPDNLDGQFVAPAAFSERLAPSYRRAAATLHAADKLLLVHAGGPCRRLLRLLVECGVDGIEGVSGPPQGDATISEARALAGPNLTIWGGIPQDALIPSTDWVAFELATREAAAQAGDDPRAIVGVADVVPVDADVDRLRAIASLIV